MPKALKEEYVPAWWTEWRERGQSDQVSATSEVQVPVDIIAVQGLASTYEWTWTKEGPDGSKTMWLRDLLPKDLPNARIMTFEYDSRWLQDPSLVDLKACGERLLESVLWDRTHKGSGHTCPIMSRRPLILLGHSFGGLVIKQALVTAAEQPSEDYDAFISAVAGVIFLGTPHLGSSFADAAYFQAWIKKATGHVTNTDILKTLKVKSNILADLQQDYANVLDNNDRLTGLMSTYCYETKPLRLGLFETTLVVPADSACYGCRLKEDEVPLDANHMEMNKFGSSQESNYVRVMRRLSEVHKRAAQTVEARLGKYHYQSQMPGGVVMEIRQWLSPEAVFNDLYEARQKDRLAGTCEWAGELDEIRNWAGLTTFPFGLPTSDRRLVWISGKAGSGKSVLAVWLYDRLSHIIQKNNWSATDVSRCSGSSDTIDCQHHTVTNNKAVLYFPISKSSTSVSVVRTLIHQLLSYQPTRSELQDWVSKEKGRREECTSDHGMRILAKLLRFFPVTYIIIDGLDECNDPRDIIERFKAVENMGNVRLLFLARQDEELQQTASRTFAQSQWQELDVSHYNSDDIYSFIQGEVTSLSKTNPVVAEEAEIIIGQICQKARGMFQWVKLVSYAIRVAKTKHEVLSTVDRFPKKLNEAYANTFNRLSQGPRFDPDIAILVLKVLSAAYRSLTWQELAMVVKVQQKIDDIQKVDAQSIQACINFAKEEVEILKATEGPNYFSFLGPLLDIRYTTTAEHATEPEDAVGKPVTIITMCHHSLQQWIDGSESLVDRNSDLWKQYHFTRTEAHHALGSISLFMLSSRPVLSEFLRTYYNPDNAATFVHYCGKYAFAHLRAIGTSAPLYRMNTRKEEEGTGPTIVLLDLAKMMLDHDLDIAAGVCAVLSKSLGDIDMKLVRHLPKVVALRRLKSALLPVSKSLLNVRANFNDFFRSIGEHTMVKGFQISDNGEDADSHSALQVTALGSLGPKLDSNLTLRILNGTETWASSNLQTDRRRKTHWKSQIKLFCETARHLRQLAILLPVDPVRAWIYAHVGEEGVSPLVALAHASEGIDVCLAASLLPRERLRKYDIAERFSAKADHPYYGHITATSHELSTKDYNGFDISFYKNNIMQHYRISQWEWIRTRMIIAAMEMTDVDAYEMNSMLKRWAVEHGMFSRDAERAITAMDIIDKVPFQKMSSRIVTARDRIVMCLEVTLVYVFKYLTHVYPPLQGVLLGARDMLGGYIVILRPTIRSLFSNRNDFLIAFVLYLIRNRYAPWIFGNPRASPIVDLRGILRDPKEYRAVGPIGWPLEPGWISFIFVMIQESGFWWWMITDILDTLEDDGRRPSAQGLERRISFRVDLANTDTLTALGKLKRAFQSHGPAWLATFRRIICVEKLFLYSSYWLFDLVQSSAGLLLSDRWNWKEISRYTSQLVGFVYARTAGVGGGIKAIIRAYFWSAVIDRFHPTSLAGLVCRYILRPALDWLLEACKGIIQFMVDKRDALVRLLDLVEAILLSMVRQLDFRTLVFCTAGGICAFGVLFWYMTTDPLGLQSAARSCTEAERLAKKATSLKDPISFLDWHANPTGHLKMISFEDRLVELDGEL